MFLYDLSGTPPSKGRRGMILDPQFYYPTNISNVSQNFFIRKSQSREANFFKFTLSLFI